MAAAAITLGSAGTALAQDGVLHLTSDIVNCFLQEDADTIVYQDGAWQTLYSRPFCVPVPDGDPLCGCGPTALAVDQDARRVYFTDGAGSQIGWWDSSDGSFEASTVVLPLSLTAMAFNGANGMLYGIDRNPLVPKVLRIDPDGFETTQLFNYLGTDYRFRDLSYNPADETFYAYNDDPSTTQPEGVYSIDMATEEITLVASAPCSGCELALAVWGDDLTLLGLSGEDSYQGTLSAGGGWSVFTPSPSPTDALEQRGTAVAGWLTTASEPCKADLDGDGELTLFDFLAFQNLFGTGDVAADFDGDGELTIFDFLAFQNLFATGCS
ncbi:MAG: hypothetical protein NCW75_03995 [Phycisphaera sp.]|nr:MAG: hypothetical protein NCW75_03995 [Phycisphaera sp.]